MSVNREDLKRMIDQVPEQDALEVHEFIRCYEIIVNSGVNDEFDIKIQCFVHRNHILCRNG
ncbi:hypothetical protein [Neobacillus soli]|uniref:hypothetical protein n=1 Tax=Neobacillus soli TaxID=220688 RepID=UPI0008268D29|nr:hypothetical protein [Neobacillus soli]